MRAFRELRVVTSGMWCACATVVGSWCKCIGGTVSEASVGMVRVGRWVGVGVRVLMLEWVSVVEVGLGVWRLGSKSSIVEGYWGMVIARVLSVLVEQMVVEGVRACIVLTVPR